MGSVRRGFCVLACLAAAAAPAWGASSPKLQVVANDLNNPRKISVGTDGALYVVEAGSGSNVGTQRCLRSCVGHTGAVVRIAGGKVARVVTGLGSYSVPGGQEAEGPVAARASGSHYVVLMQDMQLDPRGRNELGLVHAGDLLTTPPGVVSASTLASFGPFEAKHNPDHGAGPGPSYAQPSIDSDPYGFVPYRGGYAVVDAAGNDLLWVTPSGAIKVLAVFPTRPVELTAAERRQHRPRAPAVLPVQSVPSAVTVGPDGALYVGEFTGWPYRSGTARVWRVEPGTKPAVYADGFTNISDLAFAGKDLLVLELSSSGILGGEQGALIRIGPGGRKTLIASRGLVAPSGLALAGGYIYIANYGTSPAAGVGPHGQLVRFPVPG
jgi:hypothetical protein